ncbi:MAG: hypothetical protein PVG49_21165 [Desulfobacteraceae bacterium]
MSKRHRFQVEELARFLIYMLGHRPDEFGLVPDSDGFVPVKRLLQAIREEPGWRHVGEGLLREVLPSEHRGLFDAEENRIRAVERRFHLDLDAPVQPPPGLLYTPVRKRAHFHALEKGLGPHPHGFHVLTPDPDMAQRIGHRSDPSPVLLEVRIPERGDGALPLYPFGDLFLAAEVPAKDIVGPPLGKDDLKDFESRRERPTKEKPSPGKSRFDAGTFVLDSSRDPDRSRKERKGRKRRTWKEDARKNRRHP